MRVAAGSEKLGDVGSAPAAKPVAWVAAQIDRRSPVELGSRQIEIALPGDIHLFERHATRSVACAAMPQALDQIGSAVPLLILRPIRHEAGIVLKREIPQGERPTDAERPSDRARLVGFVCRDDAGLEIGEEILQILVRDFGIGRVGHCGIEARSVRRHSEPHDANEILETVIADSRVAIGGNVGRVDRSGRRREGVAPGERLPARNRVAGGAIAEHRDIFAVLHVRLPLSQQRRDLRIGNMQGRGTDGRSRHNKREGGDRPRATRVHSRTIGPGSLR